ncbi:unnamed protein product, partial [Bubo scandiacus]
MVGGGKFQHQWSMLDCGMQKYHNISCFWEKQPRGCLRISCAFHHSQPQHINGLFLPPTNNAPLQQAIQEGILHPAPHQEPRRHQQNIRLPIHPPLIINLGDEEDDEDDEEEEENYVPTWVPTTDADIEEERAIKEICYKSGEYYRIQPPREHQSTKTESSPREKELSPWEATNRHLQKGDGNTIPTMFNNAKREGERSGSRVAIENVPRTDRTAFEKGGCQFLKNSTTFLFGFSLLGIHTSNPRVKPSYQQRGQRKGDETDSSHLCVTQTGRKSSFRPPEPRRKAYVIYRSVTAKQEPRFSEATAVPEPHGPKCPKQKNQLNTKRRPGTQMQNYDKYHQDPLTHQLGGKEIHTEKHALTSKPPF